MMLLRLVLREMVLAGWWTPRPAPPERLRVTVAGRVVYVTDDRGNATEAAVLSHSAPWWFALWLQRQRPEARG